MGLDMYLSASKFVGNYEHCDEKEKQTYKTISKCLGLDGFECSNSPSLTVDLTVAYWRKANAIHRWFVSKVQDNVDNCEKHYVTREALEALLRDCKEVMAYKDRGDEKKIAMSTLPPQEGFFFGSTDINDGYYQDVEITINQIEQILENPKLKDFEFYYQSSW